MTRRGRTDLSMAQQAMALRGKWPDSKLSLSPTNLVWIGTLQPSAVSPIYTVRIAYKRSGRPHITVLDPKLDPGHQDRLPHVYPDDELCVYTPGEWDGSSLLATTVVPWTAEWLFHYELWKVTDHWAGGGDVYAPKDP